VTKIWFDEDDLESRIPGSEKLKIAKNWQQAAELLTRRILA
jgi:hypothetical protein